MKTNTRVPFSGREVEEQAFLIWFMVRMLNVMINGTVSAVNAMACLMTASIGFLGRQGCRRAFERRLQTLLGSAVSRVQSSSTRPAATARKSMGC